MIFLECKRFKKLDKHVHVELLIFGTNAPRFVILWVFYLIHSLNYLTGGSVRGKAGPNWVRKIFNCLRSL
jgi:hypothetical protein